MWYVSNVNGDKIEITNSMSDGNGNCEKVEFDKKILAHFVAKTNMFRNGIYGLGYKDKIELAETLEFDRVEVHRHVKPMMARIGKFYEFNTKQIIGGEAFTATIRGYVYKIREDADVYFLVDEDGQTTEVKNRYVTKTKEVLDIDDTTMRFFGYFAQTQYRIDQKIMQKEDIDEEIKEMKYELHKLFVKFRNNELS